MAQAIALSRKPLQAATTRPVEIFSSMVVLGCAAALIFAGQPLPF